MRVKVGDTVYDSDEEPVMVILTPKDRENISRMPPGNTKYCVYPPEGRWVAHNFEGIKQWMLLDEERQ